MDKNIEIGLLYEFYGILLTDKQSNIIELYYNNDLSLAEIAENFNITRQGVRKHIKDAEMQLYNYEEKLHLMKKYLENKEKFENIKYKINILKKIYNNNEILEIENEINSLM